VPEHFNMIAETGAYKLTGAEVELTHTVFRKAWERDWRWISLYVVITLGGIGASYFTSQWTSVALSSAVALATLLIGLFMARQVLTITKRIK
jgi:hypothetical protein